MGESIMEYAPPAIDYRQVNSILVKVKCPICRGKENGCYDCGGKGEIKEWVSIKDLKKSLRDTIG